MEALRSDIARIAPAHRLRSTVITPLERIPRDVGIDAAWRELRRIVTIGEQYAWLAAYVRLKGLDSMELCIHRDDKAHKLLQPYAVCCGDGKWGLTADAPPQYAFFQCFAFPIFDLTKIAMNQIAEKHGVSDILEKTWFCFTPMRGQYPCGRCNPCFFAFQERMARRIGWRGLAAGIPIRMVKEALPAPLWARLRALTRRRPSAHSGQAGAA